MKRTISDAVGGDGEADRKVFVTIGAAWPCDECADPGVEVPGFETFPIDDSRADER